MSQIEEFYKKDMEYRTAMIARQELAVQRWGEGLKKLPAGVLGDIKLPEEITLEAFMPALYKNPVDWKEYDQQYQKFTEFAEEVNQICRKYNEEAVQCLSKHQQLISRKV